ncbi:hypothetical protein ONR57_08000 [Hoyosella sp. YIM 151337]|uniref:hypothetical protein n=1 Tax=Hoyosella sp. YIM 151337 TaxID=2992742 RepID=UPI002235DAE0|nr:hypothetical protein [Hoyosella sp. YIM 151337]MCW4353239.1 hypothetical protein [Hoyosella sp. YIM 151337]
MVLPVSVRKSTLCDAVRLPNTLIRRVAREMPTRAESIAAQFFGQRLDPLSAAPGNYLARQGTKVIAVHGPYRRYPSGLRYYLRHTPDNRGGWYIFAGQLDWVTVPVIARATEATQLFASNSKLMFNSTLRRLQLEDLRVAA